MLDKLLIFSWRSCYIAHLSLQRRQLLTESGRENLRLVSSWVVKGPHGETMAPESEHTGFQCAWRCISQSRDCPVIYIMWNRMCFQREEGTGSNRCRIHCVRHHSKGGDQEMHTLQRSAVASPFRLPAFNMGSHVPQPLGITPFPRTKGHPQWLCNELGSPVCSVRNPVGCSVRRTCFSFSLFSGFICPF